MRRHAIGLIAVGLLVAALVLHVASLDASNYFMASCVRVGMMMAALWLAYPQVSRLHGWLVTLVVVSALVIAAKPRLALALVPLVLLVLLLRPRKARQQSRSG